MTKSAEELADDIAKAIVGVIEARDFRYADRGAACETAFKNLVGAIKRGLIGAAFAGSGK